jgi:hypothetical protein
MLGFAALCFLLGSLAGAVRSCCGSAIAAARWLLVVAGQQLARATAAVCRSWPLAVAGRLWASDLPPFLLGYNGLTSVASEPAHPRVAARRPRVRSFCIYPARRCGGSRVVGLQRLVRRALAAEIKARKRRGMKRKRADRAKQQEEENAIVGKRGGSEERGAKSEEQ